LGGPLEAPHLVVIGEIGRPYGLRGEVHVTPITDDPGRFGRVRECVVWDTARDAREPYRLTGARQRGDDVIVALAGCDSPEAARTLTGRFLAVPESAALPLDDAHFYPWQLTGCRVVTDEDREIGVVAGIEQSPAHDLWVVQGAGREHLIPAVAEIVHEVDLTARRVVIRPPDGLLDL
jgi:16S rRNA processing protein RimM